MVVDVMDARRPNIQENGRDMATAPDPIFLTYKKINIRKIAIFGRAVIQCSSTYQKLL